MPRTSRGLAPQYRRNATRAQRKIKDRTRHQKGTTRLDTASHEQAQGSTATSRNRPSCYGGGAGVRIDTEEVNGPIPVSPTAHGGSLTSR